MTSTELQSHLKQETKYSKLYLNIISNSVMENRVKVRKNQEGYIYFEAHHILPKSLFKEYSSFKTSPWNKVLLTPREHFICHILIWKHYKSIGYTHEERKMSRAMTMLSNRGQYNSSMYKIFKVDMNMSEETKEKMKKPKSKSHAENISKGRKGIIFTLETKTKMKEKKINTRHSKETKEKMREAKIGKKKSNEAIENMKKAKQNMSEETKEKIRESKLGKNNPKTKTLIIRDSQNVIKFKSDGSFKFFCEEKGLPYNALVTTYRKQTVISEFSAEKHGYKEYSGWYVREIN